MQLLTAAQPVDPQIDRRVETDWNKMLAGTNHLRASGQSARRLKSFAPSSHVGCTVRKLDATSELNEAEAAQLRPLPAEQALKTDLGTCAPGRAVCGRASDLLSAAPATALNDVKTALRLAFNPAETGERTAHVVRVI